MLKINSKIPTIIMANGEFPSASVPLSYLDNATSIICCDGAADALVQAGFEPTIIIGDLDSISSTLRRKYSDRLIQIDSQSSNDLAKALDWCVSENITDAVVLGATGKREDHTLGNIFLILRYFPQISCRLVTDFGIFSPFSGMAVFESHPGQQVSIFSVDSTVVLTTDGLKYPLMNSVLSSMDKGILNESTAERFSIEATHGKVFVFQNFEVR